MTSLSLAPATYYAGATITTCNWSDGDNTRKRMIRTDVTLDNTVVVTDSGYSWGDVKMSLSIEYKRVWEQVLLAWLQAWPEIIVCRFDGVYRAVLQSVQPKSGRLIIGLSVIERV